MSNESLNLLLNQGLIARAAGGPFGGHRTTEGGQWFLDSIRGKGTCPDHSDPAQDPPVNFEKRIIVQVGDIIVLTSILLGPTIYNEVFDTADMLGLKKRVSDALLSMGIGVNHALRHGVADLERRLVWSWDVGFTPRTKEVYLRVVEAHLNRVENPASRKEIRELIEYASTMCPLPIVDAADEGATPGGPRFSLLG